MKITFTLLVLFVVTFSFGAEKPNERKIILQARPQGGLFYVIVKSFSNDDIQITYMLKDSVTMEIRNNKIYRSLAQTLFDGNLHQESQRQLYLKMDSIIELYTHYTSDSIKFTAKDNPEYQKVFNTFFSSASEDHEKAYRVVLDGTSMVFTLSQENSSRKLYALSPDRDSNPLMYEFINKTMNLYRRQKPEGILSRGRTAGY